MMMVVTMIVVDDDVRGMIMFMSMFVDYVHDCGMVSVMVFVGDEYDRRDDGDDGLNSHFG